MARKKPSGIYPKALIKLFFKCSLPLFEAKNNARFAHQYDSKIFCQSITYKRAVGSLQTSNNYACRLHLQQ